MDIADAVTLNPVRALHALGQSIWLDSISRRLIGSGELAQLIANDGLRGVTSNPAIFEHAITESRDYHASLEALESSGDQDAKSLYERLAIGDVRDAADVLRPVYEASGHRDGYVSLEVSPYLAHRTEETIDEARRLWHAVERPNLMIKVPATPRGIRAIRQLISEGISVNVTLLFSVETYEQVATAYMTGLETYLDSGLDRRRVGSVASVASFFVSRIDTAVDEISPLRHLPSSPSSRRLPAMFQTRARDAGRSWPPSSRLPRRRFSVRRCINGSPLEARRTSLTVCSRRCASSSAVIASARGKRSWPVADHERPRRRYRRNVDQDSGDWPPDTDQDPIRSEPHA